MDGTFVYRLVKDKFCGISIWQLWLVDGEHYFVGNGAAVPSETTPESLRGKYEILFDAFNHPVIEWANIRVFDSTNYRVVKCQPVKDFKDY